MNFRRMADEELRGALCGLNQRINRCANEATFTGDRRRRDYLEDLGASLRRARGRALAERRYRQLAAGERAAREAADQAAREEDEKRRRWRFEAGPIGRLFREVEVVCALGRGEDPGTSWTEREPTDRQLAFLGARGVAPRAGLDRGGVARLIDVVKADPGRFPARGAGAGAPRVLDADDAALPAGGPATGLGTDWGMEFRREMTRDEYLAAMGAPDPDGVGLVREQFLRGAR